MSNTRYWLALSLLVATVALLMLLPRLVVVGALLTAACGTLAVANEPAPRLPVPASLTEAVPANGLAPASAKPPVLWLGASDAALNDEVTLDGVAVGSLPTLLAAG